MTNSPQRVGGGERCRWCGRPLPERPTGPGRPRRYCRQGCRQGAHLARKLAASHGLDDDDLVVSHRAHEELQARLYALRAAVADVDRDPPTTAAELREAVDWLLEFARPLMAVDLKAR